MLRRKLSTNIDQSVIADTEFCQALLRHNLCLCEVPARRLGDALHLRITRAQLQGGVAIFFFVADSNHLAAVHFQHRHRDMLTFVGKDAGHAQLLRDKARAHRLNPST